MKIYLNNENVELNGGNSMKQKNVVWLPHLSEEIVSDARGPELDAYAVALEGWRRGLQLKWHTKDSERFSEIKTWFVDRPGKLFSLTSGEKTHYFFRTRGDKVTNEAVEIGADKEKTKEYLLKAGVNIPDGKQFSKDVSNEEIAVYGDSLGFPVVLKPTDGSFGRGVVTNIMSEEELIQSLQHVRSQLKYEDVIVERFIPGKEYRIYVVDDKVVAAVYRIPANVVGDGENTIQTLIEKKNEERSLNPRLISCPIKVDLEMKNHLEKFGLYLESVPKKGEQVFLTDKSNVSIGGDPVDVLDELSEKVKETAVKALRAIPDLYHGAVDLIIEENEDAQQEVVIIELNPTAQIGALLYPMQGKSRDVPAAIIDFYFPETSGIHIEREKIYFDFPTVIEPLVSKSARVSTVSKAPLGNLYAIKYTVSGDVQSVDYHRGLRKQAFERNLSGFIKNLETGDIEVVVIGTEKENVGDFKNAILDDPERSDVAEIKESPWNEPVKIGFEVKADLKMQVEQLKQMMQEMNVVQKELKEAEKIYRNYSRTISWQITYPFRKITDLFKFLVRLVTK